MCLYGLFGRKYKLYESREVFALNMESVMFGIIKKISLAALAFACVLSLCACSSDSFFSLFVDEDDTSSGVYYVIYNAGSTDEELASVGDLSFMKSDLVDEIAEYDLSMEVTVAFDTETDSDATFTVWYYHNSDDEEASDYCAVGFAAIGTYVMEDDIISFTLEPEGYNIAVYRVGADYEDIDEFKAFSYAADGSCGVWAYANVTYDYEDEAEILEDVIENLPSSIDFTVSGNKITGWELIY